MLASSHLKAEVLASPGLDNLTSAIWGRRGIGLQYRVPVMIVHKANNGIQVTQQVNYGVFRLIAKSLMHQQVYASSKT